MMLDVYNYFFFFLILQVKVAWVSYLNCISLNKILPNIAEFANQSLPYKVLVTSEVVNIFRRIFK